MAARKARSRGRARPAPATGPSEARSPGRSHAPLPPSALRRASDPAALGFGTTAELDGPGGSFGQERALEALRFAVAMEQPGYNAFALGPSGVGKHATVEALLRGAAANRPVPPDWVYVHRFDRPHEPRALSLPAGRGRELTRALDQLVADLRAAIPAAFESREFATKISELQAEFQARHEALFSELERQGAARGVAVLRSPAGVAFAPVRGGEVLSPDEFEKLPEAEKLSLREAVRELERELGERAKELPRLHKELRDRVRELERAVTRYATDSAVSELRGRWASEPGVIAHLDALVEDVVEHGAEFRREEKDDAALALGLRTERRFERYQANLLVDHAESRGAPVVYDDQGSYEHLVGRIEHVAEFGNLVTSFTLIKSGSLHRASGGFLLVDARRVLSNPHAWDGLKRALFSRSVRVEPLAQLLGLSSGQSLRPEAIPLDVKVVLFGPHELYYVLADADPDFLELFKVQADFEDAIPRGPETERALARLLAGVAAARELLPLEAGAVARIVEESSRLAADSRKLSTNTRRLLALVDEAEPLARARQGAAVSLADVDAAIALRERRAGRIRERVLETISRRTVLIDTTGARVGQVNGLAALSLGDTVFGRPTRITATARIGEGRVIDIEREVELGGPLHSKGVLILSNYLAERYAKRFPLSLSASLVFEQSYGGVEGDSASLAELCALLSALAEVPIAQSVAVTGSVNQWGEVQAIGAVNEKIEGFFDACAALGAAGPHGVIIPRANADHLMLRPDVVDAARAGRFFVYTVATADEAIEILTAVPAGAPDAEGEFPEGSIGRLVEQQLVGFAIVSKRFGEFVQVDGEAEEADEPPARRRPKRRRGSH